MRHLSTKLFHLIAVFVVVIFSATSADSAPATPTNNRPEAQLSPAEVEKFLEGLTRYLHRQRLDQQVNHQQSSEEEADEVASDRKTPSMSSAEERTLDLANNSVSHSRPVGGKWPWSLANSERDGPNVKQRPPYGKRNSELINSLLGLPRIMKVVG